MAEAPAITPPPEAIAPQAIQSPHEALEDLGYPHHEQEPTVSDDKSLPHGISEQQAAPQHVGLNKAPLESVRAEIRAAVKEQEADNALEDSFDGSKEKTQQPEPKRTATSSDLGQPHQPPESSINTSPNEKSIANVSQSEKVEGDDLNRRALRLENQHLVEEKLESLYELPFAERLTRVRQGIFAGFPNLRGDPIDQFRKSHIGLLGQLQYGLKLPNGRMLQVKGATVNEARIERYMQGLSEFIDEEYAKIKGLPPDQQEQRTAAAVRLASVIFSIGIPIHPYIDGNGQTLKTTMVTYLHELGDETLQDSFFPYRLHNGIHGPSEGLSLNIGKPSQYDSASGLQSKQLEERLRTYKNLQDQMRSFPVPKRKPFFFQTQARETFAFSKQLLQEFNTQFPDLVERKHLESILAQAEGRDALMNEGNNEKLHKLSSNYLQPKLHGYLEYALYSEDGRKFLDQYIMQGETRDEEAISADANLIGYQRANLPVFLKIEKDIHEGLESRRQHNVALGQLMAA